MMNINAYELLEQMPGSVFVKRQSMNGSVYCWSNEFTSQIMGYQSPRLMEGVLDEHLQCQAKLGAQAFHDVDSAIYQGAEAHHLNLFQYAAFDVLGLLVHKKPFYNQQDGSVGLIAHGTPLYAGHLRFLAHALPLNHDHQVMPGVYRLDNYHDAGCVLTAKEAECLFWFLRGKTTKEISVILSRSYRTIEKHIVHIKDKFGVNTRSQLYEIAIEKGYLHVLPKHMFLHHLMSLGAL